MTTALAIFAVVTAISLVTESSSGLVTSAFAVKKGGGTNTGTNGSSKKGASNTGGSTATGSLSKFIKCVRAISGTLSRTDVTDCWDQVYGGSGSGVGGGSTFGGSTGGGGSSG